MGMGVGVRLEPRFLFFAVEEEGVPAGTDAPDGICAHIVQRSRCTQLKSSNPYGCCN